MKRFLCLIVLSVLWLGTSVYGQASRTESEIRSDPKNIREIFLTLPWPKSEKDSVTGRVGEKVGAFDQRQKLVDQIALGKDNSVMDLANGYLKMDLQEGLQLVMTYFQKSDNSRLVVLQVADADTPGVNPATDNYLFTLSHGNYQPELLTTYLPKFELVDFWGTQPLPRPALRKLLSDPFYIEWPRKGTIAIVVFDEPDFDIESKEVLELEKAMTKRQFDRMELVWDKQANVFKKGHKTKDQK
jgi:hypothetical protein